MFGSSAQSFPAIMRGLTVAQRLTAMAGLDMKRGKPHLAQGLSPLAMPHPTTSPTNFIAGYGGGLYLGVGNGNVANSKTFRLNAGANGFAYAATGTGTDTQLFTGLLSGTTNLGAPLGAGIVGAKWRSTLSFLTLQNGVITAIEKEGFSLTTEL